MRPVAGILTCLCPCNTQGHLAAMYKGRWVVSTRRHGCLVSCFHLIQRCGPHCRSACHPLCSVCPTRCGSCCLHTMCCLVPVLSCYWGGKIRGGMYAVRAWLNHDYVYGSHWFAILSKLPATSRHLDMTVVGVHACILREQRRLWENCLLHCCCGPCALW